MLFHERKFPWLDVAVEEDVSTSSEQSLRRSMARRGLAVYFIFLVLFSALTNWFSAATGDTFGIFFLMWSPGMASIVTRLILHEGWSDISFRLVPKSFAKLSGGRTVRLAIMIAVLVPFVAALLAYGCAWIMGLAHPVAFQPSTNLSFCIAFLGGHLSWWMITLLLIGFLLAELVSAAGEEIGWRGYMLTRLIDADIPRPVVLSGLIWSFWHWPLLFLEAQHLNIEIFLSACIFVVTITCLGCVAARLRLQTGSIWPSIVLHGTWNICILEIFDAFTRNSATSYWVGESGLLIALVMLGMACIFWHNYRFVLPETKVTS